MWVKTLGSTIQTYRSMIGCQELGFYMGTLNPLHFLCWGMLTSKFVTISKGIISIFYIWPSIPLLNISDMPNSLFYFTDLKIKVKYYFHEVDFLYTFAGEPFFCTTFYSFTVLPVYLRKIVLHIFKLLYFI